MQLNVTLSGRSISWRFPGSSTFDRWLRSYPWRSDGGLRICRVQSVDLLPEFSAAVRQAILAQDDGRSLLRICLIRQETVSQSKGNLEELLLNRLEVPDSSSPYQRLLEAARLIDMRPTIFIIESGYPDLRSTSECAAIFLDRIEKVGGDKRPTIIVLALSDEPTFGLPDEFRTGFPADGILLDPQLPSLDLWRSYLHVRLSWEAGGDLGRALTWDRKYNVGDFPLDHDNSLEKSLNQGAESDLSELSSDTVKQLEHTLRTSSSVADRTTYTWKNPASDLVSSGVMWAPSNGPLRPTPWVARALLRSGNWSSQSSQLRNCIVCAPLARDMLFACFDMEAMERCHCSGLLPNEQAAPEEVRNLLQRFQDAGDRSEYKYYPLNCPAVPTSAWSFASFGQILEHARVMNGDRSRRDWQHALRRLRNALSHGHYVSWMTVMELKKIQRELGFLRVI